MSFTILKQLCKPDLSLAQVTTLQTLSREARLTKSPSSIYALACFLSQICRWEQSLIYFQRALQNVEDRRSSLGKDILYHQGLTFLNASRYEEAIAVFSELTAHDSSVLSSWVGLGRAYKGLEKWELAEQAFRQAHELQPEDAWISVLLGEAYSRQKKWKEARPHMERIFLLRSQHYSYYYALGMVYYRLSRKGKAKEMFILALELAELEPDPDLDTVDPNGFKIFEHIAVCFHAMGNQALMERSIEVIRKFAAPPGLGDPNSLNSMHVIFEPRVNTYNVGQGKESNHA